MFDDFVKLYHLVAINERQQVCFVNDILSLFQSLLVIELHCEAHLIRFSLKFEHCCALSTLSQLLDWLVNFRWILFLDLDVRQPRLKLLRPTNND